MHAELGVVECHAQPAGPAELHRVCLDDEVLWLVRHHVLDDLPRVLATVLDQPVEFDDCFVLVQAQHDGSLSLFCAVLRAARFVALSYRQSGERSDRHRAGSSTLRNTRK